MTSVGVIAHQRKSFGGGLAQLRQLLADRGFAEPIWYEVPKSRKAPKMARRAIDDGADLLLLWGGDGTVQRCIDALSGSDITVAIMPAGTANLLANNLGIPMDLPAALDVALHGSRRRLDVGVLNGERFAVMAGAGVDAMMMRDASGLKDRFGKLAYVWTGARATRSKAVRMSVDVDGSSWFKGRASCLLLGNMGTLSGGLTAFANARPDDGLLEIGAVTAQGAVQWARVFSRLATGQADRSKLVRTTRGRQVDVRCNRAVAYELDGGARTPTRRLKASVEPGAITVCVPETSENMVTGSPRSSVPGRVSRYLGR
jgi:diacylglycerol kinase (ATP)